MLSTFVFKAHRMRHQVSNTTMPSSTSTQLRWCINIDTVLFMSSPILDVRFFATDSGNEPVREWLKSLPASERRTIGEDIKTVQFGWPLGMPLVRKLAKDLWEVRIHLVDRIARVLFTVVGHTMVLLHGFIKKSQATAPEELDVAKRRLQQLRSAS